MSESGPTAVAAAAAPILASSLATSPSKSAGFDFSTPAKHHDDLSAGALRFHDAVAPLPGRNKARRRPMSGYPTASTVDDAIFVPLRKYTDPSPSSGQYMPPRESPPLRQELDVDLDAYSTTEYDGDGDGDGDGDDGEIGLEDSRAPTLSFVTTSTVESAASTPPMGVQYGFRPDVLDGKGELEPRVRMRTTAGRSNAYSSAESSMASGAYSVHGYAADQVFHHPHAPPLPSLPNAYAANSPPQIGLGITSHDIVLPARTRTPESPLAISPSQSFGHRPWRRDHLRSDSGSSSITSTSASSENEAGPSRAPASVSPSSALFSGYHFEDRLPWDSHSSGDESEAKAVTMVVEGKEKILDVTKLIAMGGIDALTETVIESLAGTTHLILPRVGSGLLHSISSLLLTLAPSLVVLDLSDNDFSFIPESLRQCGCLEELNFSGNPIRMLPNWLSEVTSLRVLAADRCGLPSLPADLARLSSLHTICARDNRLPSLPSWLCLLPHLQTLRVDGNPFSPEWKAVVSPILRTSPSVPLNTNSLREAPSVASLSSSMTASSIAPSLNASSSLNSIKAESWMSPSSSVGQSLRGMSTLGPIAEDQPHSAPIVEQRESPDSQDHQRSDSIAQRGLRKMRSTGALLDQQLGLVGASQSTAALVSPSGRFSSLGSTDGRRTLSVVGEPDELANAPVASASRSNSVSSTTSPKNQKEKKWGFLRKMSINRLKGDKTAMSASASANIKLMPPPMQHQHSAPIPSLPLAHRPSMHGTRSAATLPTRKLLGGTVDEFGQTSRPTSPTTLPVHTPLALPALATLFSSAEASSTAAPARSKRRSFLPIDGPPLINIAIPSISPFMPAVGILGETPADPNNAEPPADTDEPALTADHAIVESPADLRDAEARYATGLESIKSYLRDLYDLSRSPIEPYGGFEVLEGSLPTSPSETIGSPDSAVRNPVSEARRNRAMTMEGSAEGSSQIHSGNVSPDPRASSTELETSKKFKNDRSKRSKVIREIYETERTYVRGLGELVSIYVKPASQPVKVGQPETVIPSAERKVVFGGIESILTIHRDNLLRALENAVKPLLEGTDDPEGELSTQAAHHVGEVFRTYIAYMKQYSTYINNFDNALSRMKTWTASVPPPPTVHGLRSSSTVGMTAAGMASMPSLHLGENVHSGNVMTTGQRKRVKAFLKKCRDHPKHSQINLESYLLLPIQRVPRYKLLLEDLAMCTPPREDGPRDTLDDALHEIGALASLMNEEKRDADSRLRLFQWQKRITSRGPSPLVQPHRKLILDGPLQLIRLVKKASSFVEVDNAPQLDAEHTIMPSKAIVPVEYINPEPLDKQMMLILCTDLMVLVAQRNEGWEGQVDLFNVLRMATLREPASIVNGGNVLRVVDNKSIYYFQADSSESIVNWCRAINTARRR